MKSKIAIVCFAVLAVFFSTYQLTESPSVWYDEGFYVQSAANLAAFGKTGLQLAPGYIEPSSKFISVGYPLIYPLALWFKGFGISIASARSLMVLFILGSLVASYILVRRLFGGTLALGTLALLTTLPPLYGDGKSVLGEVPGLLYFTLFLICFNSARSGTAKKYLWLVAAGIFAGLCVATKPLFILLLPAIAVGTFVEWKRGALNVKEILTASVAGIVPIIYWIAVQFQTNDSVGGVLAEYANPYQIPDLPHVILVNISHLFTDVGTLYLTIMTVVWISALLLRARLREKVSAEEIISLVFSLLVIIAYTRTAGWYRYLFEAQAISLFFFPNALLVVTSRMRDAARAFVPKLAAWLPGAGKGVFVAIALLSTLGAYQVMFNSWVATAYGSHETAFWEQHFSAVSSSTPLFFYDVPEIAFFSSSRNYHQFINPAGWPIGEDQLAVLEKGGADEVIVRSIAYEGGKDDTFKLYKETQTAYKFSILKKR